MTVQLLLSLALIVATVVIHFIGLTSLMAFLRWRRNRITGSLWRQGLAIIMVVLGLFALHGLQIWIYALVYLAIGEMPTLEAAVYFSASTFTTVGFGDLYLDEQWRLLSAIESANGFLLIGWSTAFLVTVTARLGAFEKRLEDQLDE